MSNKTPESSPEKTGSALKIGLGLILLITLSSLSWQLAYKNAAPVATECEINQSLDAKTLYANKVAVRAEIAETGEDQARGLSGRDCLNENAGMLFPYALSGDLCFWMKDMKFPIDMIWLDDDKKIINIKEHVAPDTYPQSFCPEKPARYVLEVDAGFAKDSGWQSDTQFSW